ncbi:hypothetical protein TGPRC2_205080 [Toxoplasma gondii TgCatPRC2]|uniref:Coiled-coil domain-containing protein 153 n=15 Tax=Toxoplasma gondii TaxID=5811 RepID=B9Q083_TOXGV|nr:hypothetical protein TGME49_205080 [Toxoplasma gondii ME49]EPR61402.1 hypothetical protein TGGT1_205080 [Toxoplasma gondii GT1]ESS33254.1 hypothetical protein TGVEG_205080 [Toxoplasma gondii VEG]KAF4642718.1 hypothetical protein TGRH88_034440 [Toxoplasma gondii]KFG33595.1 hypothetical protein TGP89_205080 [Toxoplasma gondii p89]KFG36702.1 hypothetical protein TGFOU_205080 [Toxoplasma gondii FOU]KFG38159.1 hypothetical protein TGDOM2_205080 [Toxoplasma gondii GAB2-2007-GAL-DOM2]KFG59177.1 |eukprot:XP_002367740.1 hypothetical protein TGME49_205080 [Toxoplasma gondii ME49]
MSAKPQTKNKKNDEERNYELENEIMRRRIQTIREMIATKQKQTEESEQRIKRLKYNYTRIDNAFRAEAAKAEPGYQELQQRYADMRTTYQRILEEVKEQVAKAQRDNELLEKEIVTTGLHKDHVVEGKRSMMKRLERELESMALEFSEILMETADKMTASITVSHSTWESNNGHLPLINRLQDFSLVDPPAL